MGLDMYLSKRHYVQNWEHKGPAGQFDITVKRGGKKIPIINTSKITYIIEQVGYWRKANQIHDWFIKNCAEGVDNYQEVYVSLSKLQELLDTCILVRDNSKVVDGEINNGYTINEDGEKVYNRIPGKVVVDSSVAEDLLPGSEGFFFGGTDYDEYYMDDINNTIEMLEGELNNSSSSEFDTPEYSYRASW